MNIAYVLNGQEAIDEGLNEPKSERNALQFSIYGHHMPEQMHKNNCPIEEQFTHQTVPRIGLSGESNKSIL